MPKGKQHKRYKPEYKIMVVETMEKEKLSYREAAKRYEVSSHALIMKWERIYLEKGKEGLYSENRGKKTGEGKGRPPKFDKKAEEDLIEQVQRLKAENAYLKKLNALVAERVRQEKKHK